MKDMPVSPYIDGTALRSTEDGSNDDDDDDDDVSGDGDYAALQFPVPREGLVELTKKVVENKVSRSSVASGVGNHNASTGNTARTNNSNQAMGNISSASINNNGVSAHAALNPPSMALPPRPSRPVSSHGQHPNNNNATSNNSSTNPLLSTPARGSISTGNGKTHTISSHTPDFRERTVGEYQSNAAYTTPTSTAFAPSGRPPLNDEDGEEEEGEGVLPKTPLTTMRDLMSSMSKDRSEIEGARRPLFVSEDDRDNRQNQSQELPDSNRLNNSPSMEDEEYSEEEDGEWDDDDDAENEMCNKFFERREINSSCLPYGSEIVIRFHAPNLLTSISIQPQAAAAGSRECIVANEAYGPLRGGITGENRFVITKDDSLSTPNDPASSFVCFGDVVLLRSDVIDRLLGVRKAEIKDDEDLGNNAIDFEIGCFRHLGRFPQGDRWTILRGGANAPIIQLGSSDYESFDENRIPVYYGDSIVLRNFWTGGILSLGNNLESDNLSPGISGWSLQIVTSSYEMNDGTASTENGQPLIEYMHKHNQCRPSKRETFQICSPNVPLCPDWVYPTGDGLDRTYLSGAYLTHHHRHDLSSEMELDRFSDVRPRGLSDDNKYQITSQQLALQSVDSQESILLDEIIGAMMGLEGNFFRFLSANEGFDKFTFIGEDIDASLANIVSRILPLCTNYFYVNQYVASTLNHYECGVIARVLCESMGSLLEEYLTFVSNLNYLLHEQPTGGRKLTMSMVYVHVQPSIRTMSVLYQVVAAVQDKKGGALLSSLQNLMTSHYTGDEKGNGILTLLLNKCAAPYARMLQSWLNSGKLHDPFSEFMIEITSRTFRESHVTMEDGMEWVDWCRVQDEHVLKSLLSSGKTISTKRALLGDDRFRSTSYMSAVDKVHRTGKYWRTIHLCQDGMPGSPPFDGDESSDEAAVLLNPLKLSRHIDNSYQRASDALLHLLLHKYDVLSSLNVMKKYFLLDQGDFFVEFLDVAEDELLRELPNVSQGRVQNCLASSIAKTSEAASDVDPQHYSDTTHASQLASALRCNFKKKSLLDQLDELHRKSNAGASIKRKGQRNLAGFEALELDFESVPFPTSLVLNNHQIRSYRFIFRQIFFAKYVERQLVKMWSDHQLLKQMISIRTAFSPTLCLRRRMIHFIQNFVYYMKFDVIEPNWRELESKLKAAREFCSSKNASCNSSTNQFPLTVDDMLAEHNQFLIRIFTQCLLTNPDLIRTVSKLMTTCLLFSSQIKNFIETTKLHDYFEITRLERSKLRQGGRHSEKKNAGKANGSDFRAKRDERIQRCSERILGELKTENYQHMIRRFDEVFSSHLAEFMKLLKSDYGRRSNAHLTNLFMQLDYNDFVSSSMYAKK